MINPRAMLACQPATMLKLVAILLLLNLANSQYWKNQNWQSSPAKILLPKIIQVLHSFQKTLKDEIENKNKMSPIEEVKRNCWLLEKLSHRTGKDFIKHCMRQVIGQVTKKMTYRNDAINVIQLYIRVSVVLC